MIRAILSATTLALAVLALPIIGAVVLVPFLFGAFLLSTAAVIERHGGAPVERKAPSLDARAWRGDSAD